MPSLNEYITQATQAFLQSRKKEVKKKQVKLIIMLNVI